MGLFLRGEEVAAVAAHTQTDEQEEPQKQAPEKEEGLADLDLAYSTTTFVCKVEESSTYINVVHFGIILFTQQSIE